MKSKVNGQGLQWVKWTEWKKKFIKNSQKTDPDRTDISKSLTQFKLLPTTVKQIAKTTSNFILNTNNCVFLRYTQIW
jgi:hypothetical protein